MGLSSNRWTLQVYKIMQTFLPYADFKKSAEVLDTKRLGKQRVEAYTIINILEGRTKSDAWKNHPAVLMWHGHVEALKQYFNVISKEWIKRGFKHTMGFYEENNNCKMPLWLGNKNFHESHKSNLLRKDKAYYSQFFSNIEENLDYVWPVYSKIT